MQNHPRETFTAENGLQRVTAAKRVSIFFLALKVKGAFCRLKMTLSPKSRNKHCEIFRIHCGSKRTDGVQKAYWNSSQETEGQNMSPKWPRAELRLKYF